eukprot:TRINITY_DN474_c0_g8_i1.p1 TRINITY_DN474_c0_g8~~TRINITY_DN474_c0_g8_i1.p1  ORF type:complete len:146 (+),score=38.44 TRINITY_DN474_c0_g8_i1:33-440(+)
MLSRLLKEHQNRQNALRDHTEKLRKQALDSVNVTTNGLLDSVNIGVASVFANQKRLEREAQTLLTESARFSKQTARWLSLLDNFNNSLKEIGDIENWARIIETDMLAISQTLETIHQTTSASAPPASLSSQPSLL